MTHFASEKQQGVSDQHVLSSRTPHAREERSPVLTDGTNQLGAGHDRRGLDAQDVATRRGRSSARRRASSSRSKPPSGPMTTGSRATASSIGSRPPTSAIACRSVRAPLEASWPRSSAARYGGSASRPRGRCGTSARAASTVARVPAHHAIAWLVERDPVDTELGELLHHPLGPVTFRDRAAIVSACAAGSGGSGSWLSPRRATPGGGGPPSLTVADGDPRSLRTAARGRDGARRRRRAAERRATRRTRAPRWNAARVHWNADLMRENSPCSAVHVLTPPLGEASSAARPRTR
jgi:hypothetical protein